MLVQSFTARCSRVRSAAFPDMRYNDTLSAPRDMCECLPSTSVLSWSDTCICTRSGRRHSCLSVWNRRYKGAPWDYKSPLFRTVDRYGDMQRQAWSERHCSLEQAGVWLPRNPPLLWGGRNFAQVGMTRAFLYMWCAPLGCLANRKTSVCYKFSLAKGHFPSLKEKQIPLSVLRVLSDMNGSTAKKPHLFLLLLLPTIPFDPRQGGGKKIPLLWNLTFSEICVSAWGHVLDLQSDSAAV